MKRHKGDIKKDLDKSKNWREFHKAMDAYSIHFKPRGAGLVIEDEKGNHRIKASSLGREFSKKALEDKFGPYQAPTRTEQKGKSKTTSIKAKKDSYKRRPTTKHPKTQKYWKRYIGAKNGQQALMNKAFRSFKEFLQYEALNDPLAMAIIHYQKKMVEIILQKPTKTKGNIHQK